MMFDRNRKEIINKMDLENQFGIVMLEDEKKSSRIIKEFRKLTGLTQQEVADKLDVTRNYISQLENGRIDLSLSIFFKWCLIFEVKPGQVLDKIYLDFKSE